MNDRIISENECKVFSGISKSQRQRLMRVGKFPKKYKICDRRSGWFESELNEWAEGIKRQKGENDAIVLGEHKGGCRKFHMLCVPGTKNQ